MDSNVICVNQKKIERIIKSLENNNMKGYLVNNKEIETLANTKRMNVETPYKMYGLLKNML